MTVACEEAAVYLRCSKDRNDEASVEEQEESGDARCAAEGWTPRKYRDNDRSASRYAKKGRDDWLRLVGDLREGRFAIVWLWESSRGDRKAYEWLGFLEDCRERGVRIYVETHGRLYDIRNNHRDWKTLAEEGVHNAYASDETSLRIRRHLAAAARKGRPHGPAGYGIRRVYHPDTGKYIRQEPDPETGPVAAEIITRISRGEPIMTIKADLEARGIPGAGGGPWDRQTIRQIGLNPAYAGLRRQPDGSWIPAWKPVVLAEVHYAAAAVLRARDSQRPSRQKHLLSYLAACECGAPLSGYANRYRTLMYKCRAHGCVNIAMEWLDRHVELAVLGARADPGAADLYRGDGEEGARHRAEAARLRAELDEWAEADISVRAYQVKEAKLLPLIARAEEAAAAASALPALGALLTAGDIRAGWKALELPSRRDVIRALMDVSVMKAPDQARASRMDPGRIVISWKEHS
jgi:DNA invertase Pin-like site-specific DNA recombinase